MYVVQLFFTTSPLDIIGVSEPNQIYFLSGILEEERISKFLLLNSETPFYFDLVFQLPCNFFL